jgi:hypothetical protein
MIMNPTQTTHKLRIQFHPGGAPVPLSDSSCQLRQRPFSAEQRKNKTLDVQVEVKTNFAERNP